MLLAASALLNIGLLAAASVAAQQGAVPSRVAWWVALACIPNAALLLAPMPARALAASRWLPVLLAAAAGGLMLAAPPVLSDDVYRFVWDARRLLEGESPYRYAPSAPQAIAFRDPDIYPHINFPYVATIYPPLAQLLFALGAFAGVLGEKAVALLGHVLATWVLAVGSSSMLKAPEHRLRAALVYGLHPLAVTESALSGHMDAWVGLLVLGCGLLLASSRVGWAALFAGLASGIKLLGAPLLPLFAMSPLRGLLRRQGASAGFLPAGLLLVLTLAFIAPLPAAGGGDSPAGLINYSQHWRGNEGGFWLALAAARPLINLLDDRDGEGRPSGRVQLNALRPVLGWAEERGMHVRYRRGPRDAPEPLAQYPHGYAVGMLARIIAGLVVVLLAAWAGRDGPTAGGLRVVLLALLLLSPQVHPWYLLWLLPLDVAFRSNVLWVWSASVLASYAPLDGWVAMRVWLQPRWVLWAQYGLVALVGLMECRASKVARVDPNGAAA